jgi:hypothetical protein
MRLPGWLPWCNKPIREEPGEGTRHETCPECRKIFEEELRHYRPAPSPNRQHPEEFQPSLIESQLMLALGTFAILAIIALGSAGLHWLTNGYVPNLIQWLID